MVQVKICGIKTLADALMAVEAGADYLGFNFYTKSPRFIEPSACAKITSVIKNKFPQVLLVGVFVNADVELMNALINTCGLDFAQLHGDEPVETLNTVQPKAFKAFRGAVDVQLIKSGEPAFLLDAAVSGVFGGSGQLSDWSAAAELAKSHSFFLAGGLTPENVSDALRQVNPWGVDVASGVEARAGVKDAAKVRAFIQAVKQIKVEAGN